MKNKLLKIFLVMLIVASSLIFSVACNDENDYEEVDLLENNWESSVRTRLISLMNEVGENSANYDEDNKPYAVFDFDNTTAINDVQEAMLIYQIDNLMFKIEPEHFQEVLLTGLPDVNQDFDGVSFNASELSAEIAEHYEILYETYLGENKTEPLTKLHTTEDYFAFRAKLRYMYDAVNSTFDASVGYPWVTYLVTGMTSQEVRDMARKSNEYWFNYPTWGTKTWTTPSSKVGVCGEISVSYRTKLCIAEEMINLYDELDEHGIEVYVCSASFIDVIVETATSNLDIDEENVFAMRLKKDADGRYINEFDTNYFQTQGIGKTKTIEKFIMPQHNGDDPVLVAGDSSGDYNMMTDFSDMKVGLLINRFRTDATKDLAQQAVETHNQADAKYILQGRDENNGTFRKCSSSILLGQTEEVLVRPAS